ncbi:MAG: FAD-dependent oxidoreductase [Caldilineaceae bacterium]
MHNKRPALIVRCSGVADVIEAVNFARTHGLLTAIRGGGHNVAGTGSCEGGLMIDLSLMRGVRVDREKCTVHAQGGATGAMWIGRPKSSGWRHRAVLSQRRVLRD